MKGKIFTAQEVQSIIAGSKTMFREVIKPQPNSNINPVKLDYLCRTWQWATKESRRECPYQVGQKIFVKERFFVSNYIELRYEANLSIDEKYYWLPAIKMKQEHSRLTLEITDIKVERLGDISEEDAIAEGIYWEDNLGFTCGNEEGNTESPIGEFADLWNATHKKPEEKFEANPFVWVVDFKINK